jgi:hypothetical protein
LHSFQPKRLATNIYHLSPPPWGFDFLFALRHNAVRKVGEIMSAREYMKVQAETLPEQVVTEVLDFISFRKFSLNMQESDQDYLESVPVMNEILLEGMDTPLSECVPLSEVWTDV